MEILINICYRLTRLQLRTNIASIGVVAKKRVREALPSRRDNGLKWLAKGDLKEKLIVIETTCVDQRIRKLKTLSSPPSQVSLVGWSSISDKPSATMYLQFYINENGDKVYTTKKETPLGLATQSAHPARFSPDDKYSRQRVLLKKRFGLLPTQQPPLKY
ncbi:hypothetical protein VNO77_17432 [Canavalia gladiata]|uniref:Nucleolar protein 10 n=1 Tax=Canavalia gladiata TaxID=3824 RepID=A0AAN9LJP7_CANGL